jgi:tRNA pseudouridine38-40 synthase
VLAAGVAWEYRALDAARMRAAAVHLLGQHDFTSYRAQACQAKSPVRTLQRLDVARHGDFVVLDIVADAFLHHMVRNIAGVLIAIGAGERDVDWSREVLEHRDRRLGGVNAGPAGLYFVGVEYPRHYGIPYEPMRPAVW